MSDFDEEFSSLMARVRGDDSQAMAELITLYEATIRRAARRLLGKALRSSLDPTDLVQSVHLQLILGLKRKSLMINNVKQLRALVVTLLRHKLIEHWRRQAGRVRPGTAPGSARTPREVGSTITARELDPAMEAEYWDVLDGVCRRLRADDQRLIVMRLQGYSMEEIAARLEVAPAVVRMRLFRLRKRLLREKPPSDWI